LEIAIRELTRKDRKTLSNLILKATEKMEDESLLNMISSTAKTKSENKSNDAIKIGIHIVKMLFEFVEDGVVEWFADLIGVTVEDFDNLPIDVELQIVKQIIESPDSERFFTTALHLFSMTKAFKNTLKSAKNKLGIS
jgi:hypothetical protein